MTHEATETTNFQNTALFSKASQAQNDVSPELHEIQLRYKLAPTTIKTLITLHEKPERRDVLEKACFATEFKSFPIKAAEKGFFREINDHTPIPYIVRETITHPWHKVFLLVQADLQHTGWPNKLSAPGRKELLSESGRIYNVLERVLRCLVDILGTRLDGRGVTVALDVLRSVTSRVWEGGGMELLQIQGIGAAKMKRLADAGYKTIRDVKTLEFYHIERLLSRNPPFGQEILHHLAGFPVLTFKLDILSEVEECAGMDKRSLISAETIPDTSIKA